MGKYAGGLEQRKGEEGYQLGIAFHTPNVKRWCAREAREKDTGTREATQCDVILFFFQPLWVSGKKKPMHYNNTLKERHYVARRDHTP